MKVFVDENIPQISVDNLIKAGFDVSDIRGTQNEGADDDFIWNKAQREERLLITTDKGFSNKTGKPHHGIIIIKLKKPNQYKIDLGLFKALEKYKNENFLNKIIIVKDEVIITRKV